MAAGETPVLIWDRVSVRYSRRAPAAVRDVSAALGAGVHLLVGPNGAGKSTLLGASAGALRASTGTISADGIASAGRTRCEYLRRVGYLPQHVQAIPGLTAREQVAYCAWLGGVDHAQAWENAIRALDLTGLAENAHTRASRLSGGQLRRVALAGCFARGARVILLDEPTASLDPDERERLRAILAAAAVDTCLVVSTHDIGDLQLVSHSMVVMRGGELTFTGTPAQFLRAAPPDAPDKAVAAYRHYIAGAPVSDTQ